MLPASLSQQLERQDFFVNWVVSDQLRIDDKVLNFRGNVLSQKFSHVGISHCHVLKISTVDFDYRLLLTPKVNLASETIIFVLTCEVNAFEPLQNNLNPFCRLC